MKSFSSGNICAFMFAIDDSLRSLLLLCSCSILILEAGISTKVEFESISEIWSHTDTIVFSSNTLKLYDSS